MSKFTGLSGWLVASALVVATFTTAALSGPTTPAAVNGGVYNSTPPTLSDQQTGVFQLDTSGNLKVTSSGTPSGTQDTNIKQTGGNALVNDDAAAGTTAPVPVGGIYNTTLPTYTNLDRTQFQFSSRGAVNVALTDGGTNVGALGGVTGDGVTGSNVGIYTNNRLTLFNGTNWDRWLEAANALNSTGTGLATAQLVAQCDDTSPTAITENSFGNLRFGCTDHSLLMGVSNAGVATATLSAANALNSTGGGLPNAALVAQFDDTSPTTVTENLFGNVRMSANGMLYTQIGNAAGSVLATVTQPGDAVGNSAQNGINTLSRNNVFNGSTWDRQFSCPNFAAVSVTASNTTQIIALSGSTVIRICSAVLTTSLTGTFTMLSGTGSNCGTPANSTGAMGIVTATPVVIGDGAAAIYRGTAGGEFCIAAATGNITGYVMYAQY